MFIGHFAVGYAAKKFAPRASLATLLAPYFPASSFTYAALRVFFFFAISSSVG